MQQKRKMAKVNCDFCKIEFEKPESELVRNNRLKRKNYCSRFCVGKANTHNLLENYSNYNISIHAGNRRDEFIGYRDHLRRAKNRDEHCNLDLKYLKDLFELQNGKCIYSKVNLTHPTKSNPPTFMYLASLDRIDSTKGYLKGNVQFISVAMNLMKSSMTNEQVLELINHIKSLK